MNGTRATDDTWSDLPAATRDEVARLATMGKRHPDAEIAAAAGAWARGVLVQRSRARRLASGAWDVMRVAFDLVLTVADGGYGTHGVCDVSTKRGQRAVARRILRAR